MTGEGPPIPIQTVEPPPQATQPSAEMPAGRPPVPKGETTPPASAETIPPNTTETSYKQVVGWVGEVDPDKDPQAIIEQANKIRSGNNQPLLETTPETIGQIVLAQQQERINRLNDAKKKLEEAVSTPKQEEPPEESRGQVQDRINENWDKAGILLVVEADANLWDENATGITAEEKATRVAAKRWKRYFTAREEYIKNAIDSENKTKIDGGGKALTPQEIDERRTKLIKEINTSPSKINSAQFKYENGKFICCGSDGKTVVDQFTDADLIEPTRTFLTGLTNKKDADDKPTPQAAEAQGVRQVLEKYYKNGAFPARTESELQFEKRVENAITAADAVSQPLIEKAAEAIEAKQTPKEDFYLSSLAMWRKELQDLPADAALETVNAYAAIVTTATNELIEAHPELKNDPALADTLKLLQGNTEHYSNVANDPLAKRVKEIMKHIKYPPEGGNVDELIATLGPGKMLLITASLDTAVQADFQHPRPGRKTRAAELVDKLLTERVIDGAQGRFLSFLVEQQDVSTFTNTCANELRLSPDKLKELSNPLKYLQDNAENIANMIFAGKATEKLVSAFKALTKLTPEMIAKYVKEHGLPMSQILLTLMFLPMLQGVMDTGGGGGGERGGGGE